METPSARELKTLYERRFAGRQEYRNRTWRVLIDGCFGKYVSPDASVLDLGCGYGEFINQVRCATKFGMDLNSATGKMLNADVRLLQQDCSATWPLPERSLDVVFTSNLFEHLPDKQTLGKTLMQAHRCLKPDGRLIAMGPNIRYLPGAYWDFWDHCLPLTDLSLSEGLRSHGFEIERSVPRFLPYTMVDAPEYPVVLLRAYLALPIFWWLLGQQFLVIAVRPKENRPSLAGA